MKTRFLLIPILIFAILACSCSNRADDLPETTLPTEPMAVDITSEEVTTEAVTQSQITQTEPTTETEAVSTTAPTTEATNPTTTAPTTKAPVTTTAPKTKAQASQTKPTEAETTVSEDEDIMLDDEEEGSVVVCGMMTYIDEQFIDYIIHNGMVYVSHAGYSNGRDGFYNNVYIPGDKLMEITEVSNNRVIAELSEGTASVLTVGTEIYECWNQPAYILALVEEEYIPYFGLREG